MGWRLLAIPLACNVASLVVLAMGWGDELPVAAAWLAIGCVLAALARTAVTFREVRAFNEVKQQARTDRLTGLPNRRTFEGPHLLTGCAGPAPPPPCCWSTSTASSGSTTRWATRRATRCCAVGQRLRGAMCPRDILARLGGDEFAVLLSDGGVEDAVVVPSPAVASLNQAAVRPRRHVGLRVGASIGVACAPQDAATTPERLLQCADVLTYAAKSGRTAASSMITAPSSTLPQPASACRCSASCAPRWTSTSSRCTSSPRPT